MLDSLGIDTLLHQISAKITLPLHQGSVGVR